MLQKKQRWKGQRDGFKDSLAYMLGRMKGEIKSIKTPWVSWNNASTDGLEWHSTTVIGGRPGTGKTLVKDQLISESFRLNPGDDHRVLEFQFEMLARNSAIREYSRVTELSYKHLCSADGKLTEETLNKCYAYAKERVKYPIDVVEEPCTVNDFIEIIKDYMDIHATTETVRQTTEVDGKPVEKNVVIKVYKKTIITLDHSLLLKKASHEKDKYDTLYSLGEALTGLKRVYPIAFIILSQLSRGIDSPERNEDGKAGNYILTSDIFGADALLQHADLLIGLNKPGERNIRFYGPERYIIENRDILIAHFLKCRNGEICLAFFQSEFNKMRITEISPLAKQERRIKT